MINSSSFDAIATTFSGLEDVLCAEISALGARKVEKINRGVRFTCSLEILYKANLWLRTALRILVPIHAFVARNEHELYAGVQRVNWWQYMGVDDTLAVESAINTEYFNHSQYVALKTKDAIVDQFRDRTGRRPSVNVDFPTLRIHIHIFRDSATLSLDSSGDSLHRRGYRPEARAAPLNEVLAAGMLKLAGWNGQGVFLDPLCGSGTLPIEAALIARNAAPGLTRNHFGFFNWVNFKEILWKKVFAEAQSLVQKPQAEIYGSDISSESLAMARQNSARAGTEATIQWQAKDIRGQKAPTPSGLWVSNPPYGKRIGADDLEAFYKEIGDTLKKGFQGWEAWLISSNLPALKRVGLRPFKRTTLFNGPLECKFLGYRMYEGSVKKKWAAEPIT